MKKKDPNTVAEEIRGRLTREDLERSWKLEALDCLLTESEQHPEKFHKEWVSPLMAAGLTLESAFALLIEGRFLPN
jgi:hypothetical protein